MRSFSLFRLLLSAFFFLGASSSSAAVYSWYHSNGVQGPFSSARAACLDYVSQRPADWGTIYLSTTVSGASGTCHVRYMTRYPDPQDSTAPLVRRGDSCPEGATYNEATGGCEAPEPDPCQEKAGQTTNFFAYAPPGQYSLPGEYVCIGSCRAAWSGQCGSNGAGQSACWGLATFTGSACQSGDSPAGSGGPDPEDPDAPNCGAGYVWSGTTCVPKPCEGEDCDNPPPCEGENCPPEPCEGENCDPEPCEGEDCPDDGDGDGDGGDGDGDGDGDGEGDGESETGKDKDGKPCNPLTDADCVPCNPATDPSCASLVKNLDDCEVELVCQGDAIQCAILKEQRRSRCSWKWTPELTKAITDELTGPQFQLEEKTVPVANMFNEAMSKSRWLPTSCPSPKTVSVLGRSYQLSYKPVCDFASALSPLIVAFASIFFAIFVGRGIKGN